MHCFMRVCVSPEQSGANIEAVHAWLEGSEELSIHLGRGRLGFAFGHEIAGRSESGFI